MQPVQPVSLYFHIPFCRHRCAYCDFNTYARMDHLIPAYTSALENEIVRVTENAGARLPVHTIFFGGGTPSLLPLERIGGILSICHERFNLFEDVEITLEANPGTVSHQWLLGVRALGVNRLSFGMQSADPAELRFLEREHGLRDVIDAVSWSRDAGFENLSLDLIFGLPGQSLPTWEATLAAALSLHPDHLSLYALTVEEGTPLNRWVERGLVSAPDDDSAADMYDKAIEVLARHGLEQYEISNWALPGRECRHNLQYWLDLPYLGFGAGAHGYANGVRTANVKGIREYIRTVEMGTSGEFPHSPAVHSKVAINVETEMGEVMMVGLRLTERGVVDREFHARFGRHLIDVYEHPIEKLQREGLLEWKDGPGSALRLTRNGRLFGNRVFREFI